jgi:hypothetical protein
VGSVEFESAPLSAAAATQLSELAAAGGYYRLKLQVRAVCV